MARNTAQQKNDTKTATRHYVRVVAVVVFGMCLGALLMLHVYPYLTIRTPYVEVVKEEGGKVETMYALPRSLPTRLIIPKLGVDAEFEAPLALNTDGTVSVPDAYDTVGWYKLGAAPGEVGTASILGHVDSIHGPGVFYHLGQLVAGDRIFVLRGDGTTAEFAVEYLERYPQAEFPTEKVYGMTPYPSLRLITCSGVYDHGTMRYSHNAVVYARLVTPQ